MRNEKETPEERFERIAQKRVTETLKRIRLLGNLGDRRNYSYNQAHVAEMFSVIEAELRAAKSRYKAEDETPGSIFSFKKSAASKK